MNAPRTGRGAKDRPNTKLASNNSNHSKSASSQLSQPVSSSTTSTFDADRSNDTFIPKIQPTAEQMRIAQIINDGNDDPNIQTKIEQVMELTKRSKEEVHIALHDCDNDPERAALMLLEGGDQDEQGKWELSVKKRKNRQTARLEETNGTDAPNHNKENREHGDSGGGSGPGGHSKEVRFQDGHKKNRGPPRMNRGNWRNKEHEKNERNSEEGRKDKGSESRSRGNRRSRGGRSRGGGREGGDRDRGGDRASGGGGRDGGREGGREGGGRSRTFQNKNLNNECFPPAIDMWTNSTAEQSYSSTVNTTMNVGNWSDFTASEDWGNEEDWTGNLETTVFTPSNTSTQAQASEKSGPPPMASLLQRPHDTQPSKSSPPSQSQQQPPQQGHFASFPQYGAKPTEKVTSSPPPYQGVLPSEQSERPKIQRTRMVPAKIPDKAVEMPGESVASLDVQFGGLQFSDSFDFTATSETSSTVGNSAASGYGPSSSVSSIPTTSSPTFPPVVSASCPAPPTLQSNAQPTPSLNKENLQTKASQSPMSNYTMRPATSSSIDGTSANKPQDLANYYSKGNPYNNQLYSGSTYPPSNSTGNSYPSSPSASAMSYGSSPAVSNGYSSAGQAVYSTSTPSIAGQNSVKLSESLSGAQGSYSDLAQSQPSAGGLSTSASSSLKNSLPTTGKGFGTIPPGVATQTMVPQQYIMSQAPNLSFYGYYDVPMGGRGDMASMPYSGNEATKYSRSGEPEQVPTSQSQTGGAQQPYLNATAIPPGYGYYIPAHHYGAPFFPVHQASNAHGASSTQFQKPAAYGSHSFGSVGYDGLTAQSQDFIKGSYAAPSQAKAVTGADLSGSMYNKAHVQMGKSYEKPGFQGNQFGMATAANQTGAPPYNFIPVMHQPHHSLMHLRQDSPAGGAGANAPAAQQQKGKSGGYPPTYWNN